MKFLGSVSDPLPPLETSFTPCGVRRPTTADWVDRWRAASDTPLDGISQ
jgi:hypothetical protein